MILQNQIVARAPLLACGFTAAVGQIVLMRELIQVFNGNEIALGILLATWLFWIAAGSVFASAAGLAREHPRLAVATLETLLAASLPVTIWAFRSSKALFQSVPGELIGPVPMLLTSLVCLSVFCSVSGANFVAAARLIAPKRDLSTRTAAGTAYLAEAAGAAFGGVLASVVFVRFLDAFQIAAIVGLLNLAVAVAVLFHMRGKRIAIPVAAAALAAVPLLIWIAPRWDAASGARLWRGFHVLAQRDSVYGRLNVTETGTGAGAIRSLYENGSILANAPDPAAAEEAVDYALLEHAAPRRILLIGGGVNGSVAEALQHPTVVSLDYVELDPALIGLAEQFFPAQTAAFRPGSRNIDSRVHLHLLDGRRFLSETRKRFDVIIVDVPDPQTAQLNRFYTVEFFRLARAHLAPGGLVAVELRSSEETISPDLAAFLRSIRRTIGNAFPYQAAIPGETIHFFGTAAPGVLTEDPQVLLARLRERHLHTQYVREYFIPYRMTPDRMEQMETDLTPRATTPVNRDFAPVAYAFDVLLWSAQFKPDHTALFDAWFRLAEHEPFGKIAGALAFALLTGVLLIAFLAGSERRIRAAGGVSVAATGFTLMALQIFLLLGFEAVYGYVYTELAILIGLFMAGIALGSWLGIQRSEARTGWTLTATQLYLAISGPALLLVVHTLQVLPLHTATWLAAEIVFPALAALAGALGGFQFVTAAGVFIGRGNERAGLGLLYAIDLAGGCAGALALSTFLIPVFGFWRTAWLAVGINAVTALVVAGASLHHSEPTFARR